MEISYKCLYCEQENHITLMQMQDDYIPCERCQGLHDIDIDNNGELTVEPF